MGGLALGASTSFGRITNSFCGDGGWSWIDHLMYFSYFFTTAGTPFFYLLPITAFLWWTFLNVTKTFSKYFLSPSNFFESQIDLMSSGLIFWQTLNGMYILQLVSILIGIAIALDKKVYGSKLFAVYLILLGTFSGMTGPTLALSILVLILFFAIVYCLCASRTSIIFYLHCLIYCFSTSAGLFLSLFLSPGNKNRQSILGADYNFSALNFINIINDAFQFGLILWLKCYLAIGAIFVFIFITSFIATHSKLLQISSFKLVITGLLFSLFALLQMVINRASEYFAYQGYWHFVSALSCIFLSLIFFGTALGLGIAQKLPIKRVQSFNVAALFGLLAIASFSNYSVIESIFERHVRWSGGAAPILGVTDIEEEWVRNCWIGLNETRSSQITR